MLAWEKYAIARGLMIFLALISLSVSATRLTDVKVYPGERNTRIIFSSDDRPIYALFPLYGSEGIVLELGQYGNIVGLPLTFSGANLVKRIRSSPSKSKEKTRLVIELAKKVTVHAITQSQDNRYRLVLTLTEDQNNQTIVSSSRKTDHHPGRNSDTQKSAVIKKSDRVRSRHAAHPVKMAVNSRGHRIVVAIDAGHGGQDPGAIGINGLQEKKLTMSITQKLSQVLKRDPMFEPVLTRTGDYFVSVIKRSDIARQHGADILISIHADAAPNRSATGSSVWVLSNRRANSEMGNWLEQHEKQSELLGGVGTMLANTLADPYLSQAVLDLQFGHSQRVGYEVAVKVLRELQDISRIHKQHPEHASLGILRSPDIPSLLIETGFISNNLEERLLSTEHYQDKLVQAIYKGLRAYFQAYSLQMTAQKKTQQTGTVDSRLRPFIDHLRQPGPILSAENNQSEQVDARNVFIQTKPSKNTLKKTIKHTVKRGDTLSAIAVRYGVSMNELQRVNKIKSGQVHIGQMLAIPLPVLPP